MAEKVTENKIPNSNAKTTLVQSTQMQRFLKTILTLSCWYSLESSHWVLSDEYPISKVSVIFFSFFVLFSFGKISHQQQKSWAIYVHSNWKQPDNFDEVLQAIAQVGKYLIHEEMIIRTLPTTLLQIFCSLQF